MRHIIWRNRASAILGILVMLVPFTGFPEIMRDSLIVLAGFLITLFGFYHGSANYAIVEETLVVTNVNSEEEKTKTHRRAKKEDSSHDEPSSLS